MTCTILDAIDHWLANPPLVAEYKPASDIKLCTNCGFIKGSEDCCKTGEKQKCLSFGLVKCTPGCYKIKLNQKVPLIRPVIGWDYRVTLMCTLAFYPKWVSVLYDILNGLHNWRSL